MAYLKPPFTYTGSSFKTLKAIEAAWPKQVVLLEDWFTGSMCVPLNMRFARLFTNDANVHLMALLIGLGRSHPQRFLWQLETLREGFGLSRTNAKGYYALRDIYNDRNEVELMSRLQSAPKSALVGLTARSEAVLFMLIQHSYNNIIRFNKSGGFNAPFGKRTYTDENRKRLIDFLVTIQGWESWTAQSADFRDLPIDHLGFNDLVFVDPPYLLGGAVYNMGWSDQEDHDLYAKLDAVNAQGSRFLLTNFVEHQGKTNSILRDWSAKYRVIPIESAYNTSYKGTKRVRGRTQEVIVINYEV